MTTAICVFETDAMKTYYAYSSEATDVERVRRALERQYQKRNCRKCAASGETRKSLSIWWDSRSDLSCDTFEEDRVIKDPVRRFRISRRVVRALCVDSKPMWPLTENQELRMRWQEKIYLSSTIFGSWIGLGRTQPHWQYSHYLVLNDFTALNSVFSASGNAILRLQRCACFSQPSLRHHRSFITRQHHG